MEIRTGFHIGTDQAAVYRALADPETIVGCVPGGSLRPSADTAAGTAAGSWDGDLDVKVGPASLSYGGTVTLHESDPDGGRLRYQAVGEDRRGRGGGEADIRLTVVGGPGGGTDVTVEVTMALTGIVAQFGRGMIEEVSDVMLADFATCLEAKLSGADAGPPRRRGAIGLFLRSLLRRLKRMLGRGAERQS